MALTPEDHLKLSTMLATDIDFFNTVVNELQANDAAITEKDKALEEMTAKFQDSEKRVESHIGQISNLLSKIPIANSNAPKTNAQKMQEIKDREWK